VPTAPAASDAVVTTPPHSSIDYAALVEQAKIVVDFRNATARAGVVSDKVWKL